MLHPQHFSQQILSGRLLLLAVILGGGGGVNYWGFKLELVTT